MMRAQILVEKNLLFLFSLLNIFPANHKSAKNVRHTQIILIDYLLLPSQTLFLSLSLSLSLTPLKLTDD